MRRCPAAGRQGHHLEESLRPADPAPAAAAKDGKAAAKKGPLTPAEQEQEYRKRQQEAEKTAAKADEQRKETQAKKENCDRARDAIRTYESGQRVARTDSKGERYFLNEAEVAAELAKAREAAKQFCG